MKIIEALKELPLIDKKLQKNAQLIATYAASVDAGTVYNSLKFPSVEAQTTEVNALLQSTESLVQRKARIRRALAITNAATSVTIGGHTRTITEWIEYRASGINFISDAYSKLQETNAANDVRNTKFDGTQGIKVVRHYDEKAKNEKLTQLMEIQSKIDTTLETINATTDLIEEVA